jgi:hypothetical protein
MFVCCETSAGFLWSEGGRRGHSNFPSLKSKPLETTPRNPENRTCIQRFESTN